MECVNGSKITLMDNGTMLGGCLPAKRKGKIVCTIIVDVVNVLTSLRMDLGLFWYGLNICKQC